MVSLAQTSTTNYIKIYITQSLIQMKKAYLIKDKLPFDENLIGLI